MGRRNRDPLAAKLVMRSKFRDTGGDFGGAPGTSAHYLLVFFVPLWVPGYRECGGERVSWALEWLKTDGCIYVNSFLF